MDEIFCVAKRRPKIARGERSEVPGTVITQNRVLKGRGTEPNIHLRCRTKCAPDTSAYMCRLYIWLSGAHSGRELF